MIIVYFCQQRLSKHLLSNQTTISIKPFRKCAPTQGTHLSEIADTSTSKRPLNTTETCHSPVSFISVNTEHTSSSSEF